MIIPFTIRDGEAVALWSPGGSRSIVHGPKVVFAPFKKVEPLHRIVARDGEYLEVLFRDGRTEHKAGPCELWSDPLLHSSVEVRTAIDLDAHQAVVIYRETQDGVTHRVLRGPAMFVPQSNEWLHRFQWHGDNGKGRKVPGALQFEKLRVVPDQMYFDVEGVRTSDEALITVRVMVFFELTDIERMLAQTHDPIADFINALSADVIRFAGICDFESFKTEAARLNHMDTYEQLARRAERIGYTISKVVYRGYSARDQLQAMHDNAIETRTCLVLEAETEARQQELADLKQEREHQRAERQRREDERTLSHQLAQARREREEQLADHRSREELELELTQQKHETDEVHQRNVQKLRFEEWDHLSQSGADLTAVLVAQQRNPDKLIRLEQHPSHQGELHLHEAV
jgi:regulator of protease activity HflC (stomatin/prohibitin superfamily)